MCLRWLESSGLCLHYFFMTWFICIFLAGLSVNFSWTLCNWSSFGLAVDKPASTTASAQNLGAKSESHDGQSSLKKSGGQKKSPPATPAYKKRHRGCSFCILDIENGPIPEFPPNEEVVGVITMEDVIEELLQVVMISLVSWIYSPSIRVLLQTFLIFWCLWWSFSISWIPDLFAGK